ncbi:IS30 family transposase [Streptomyces chartreusis]|uniref:IS30 family transposase n=1 Tax=Streptomyces chartreusis TaxID=1969 RepID=UPI00382815BE
MPGHWDGDLLMGTRPAAVATLVERTSRYTTIVALPDGIKVEQVAPRLPHSLLSVPSQSRRTLIYDRGREMAEQQAITTDGDADLSQQAAEPMAARHHENTHRLLRQYLPKAADLRRLNEADLDAIAYRLNRRPRKTHGYRRGTTLTF